MSCSGSCEARVQRRLNKGSEQTFCNTFDCDWYSRMLVLRRARAFRGSLVMNEPFIAWTPFPWRKRVAHRPIVQSLYGRCSHFHTLTHHSDTLRWLLALTLVVTEHRGQQRADTLRQCRLQPSVASRRVALAERRQLRPDYQKRLCICFGRRVAPSYSGLIHDGLAIFASLRGVVARLADGLGEWLHGD